MLASRRSILAAAAAAAAAPLAPRAAAARALSGLVAGQDSTVKHKEDLPDCVKQGYTHVVDAPEADSLSQQQGQAAGGAAARSAGEQKAQGHPGPKEDPYSGGDPSQQQGERE